VTHVPEEETMISARLSHASTTVVCELDGSRVGEETLAYAISYCEAHDAELLEGSLRFFVGSGRPR
jgi:hypothetical protein